MAFDIKLIETGNGGDVVNLGNDLEVDNSISTMLYLALVGGNVEESTNQRSVNTQAFDWWGNRLLMSSEPSHQFNSLTERTLNNTVLNSEGRTIIENAVKEDLKFLSKIFNIFVTVTLPFVDRVKIEILVKNNENAQETRLIINSKKSEGGDFLALDFDNNDFLI